MPKYVLLTGATGLVGRYLIRDLLLAGHRLALVIRSSRKQSAAERMEDILQMWEAELGHELPRPVCLEGDVASPALGLDEQARQWVARNCDRIIHNAAVLQFHGDDRAGEPWKTNVEGTRHTLDLCREVGIRHFHYVSTAYVSGDRVGTILEDEFDLGQGFRNDYEDSKFAAEKLVRDADCFDSLTVYRPAVIAGDSQTGYTSTYHGLFLYLRLIWLMIQNTPPGDDGVRRLHARSRLRGDELRNIVPVDWVSAVLCRLFSTPAAQGGTYHLSPADPITPRQINDYSSSYLNACGIEFCGERPADEAMNDAEKDAYASIAIYESYDVTDPRFDTQNLLKFTADLPCPSIDEPMMHRFLRYGEEDRWGKRRQKPATVPAWVGEQLQGALPSNSAETSSDASTVVGLDITGPGGGQWQLTLDGSEVLRIEPGLPAEGGVPLLRMPASYFLTLGEPDGNTERLLNESLALHGGATPDGLAEALQKLLFSASNATTTN